MPSYAVLSTKIQSKQSQGHVLIIKVDGARLGRSLRKSPKIEVNPEHLLSSFAHLKFDSWAIRNNLNQQAALVVFYLTEWSEIRFEPPETAYPGRRPAFRECSVCEK